MKDKQLALIPGNDDIVGYWLTPPSLYEKLNAEFHFDFDPCPFPRPDGFNGLYERWIGKSCYVNPPFEKGNRWINKAIKEWRKGDKTIVLVVPVKRDMLNLVKVGAELRPLTNVGWLDPRGRQTKSEWPTILAILRPQNLTVKPDQEMRKP